MVPVKNVNSNFANRIINKTKIKRNLKKYKEKQ